MIEIAGYQIGLVDCGTLALDGGAMFGVVPKPLWEKLSPPDALNRIPLAMRGLVIKGHGKVIVVDSGVGDSMHVKQRGIYNITASYSLLTSSLAQFGVSPADVTHAVVTHLHFDHACGLTHRDNENKLRATFPNAEHLVTDSHWAHAKQPTLRDRASFISEEIAFLGGEVSLKKIASGGEYFPGIDLFFANGHTIGQILVKVSDGIRTLVFPCDLVPTKNHVKLPYHMGYDLQPLVILQEKEDLLERAANNDWYFVFAHDPTTPIAKINKTNGDYWPMVDDDVAAMLAENQQR